VLIAFQFVPFTLSPTVAILKSRSDDIGSVRDDKYLLQPGRSAADLASAS
jgi:hypothetical protein